MGKFKASWAIQYAEEAYKGNLIGDPPRNNGGGYIWGSRGNLCDEAFRKQMAKDHPDQANMILGKDGKHWDGHYVWDCSGLYRGLVYAAPEVKYSGKYTGGSNSMWKSWATDKGTIDTMPHLPGIAVFHYKDGNYHHVGMYIGGGQFIDFRGTAYGAQKGDYNSYHWTHWAKLDCVDYDIPLEDNLLGPIIGQGMPTYTLPAVPIGMVEILSPKWLNIRAAKSVTSKDLGNLACGTHVEYYDDDGTWLTIKFNNGVAYCKKEFTREVTDNAEEDTMEYPKTMTVTAPKVPLNVRAKANVKSQSLGVITKGTQVTVFMIEKDWAKIKWGEGEAWVSAKYIQ